MINSQQIQAAVDKFVSDLESLIRASAVQAVQEALGVSGASRAGAAAAKPKGKPGRKPGRKRGRKPAAAAAAPAAAAPKPAAPKAAAAKAPKAAKAGKPAKAGKRVRRSAEQIEAMAKKIVTFVASHPGQRAEQIKKSLGIKDAEWSLPIASALSSKRLSTKGQKRATTYFPGK